MRRITSPFVQHGRRPGPSADLQGTQHQFSLVTDPPAAVGTPGATSAGGGSGQGGPGQGGSGTAQRSQDQQRGPHPPQAAPAAAPGGFSTTSAKTVTGDPADTMYGPVQVQITVKNGKLTGC